MALAAALLDIIQRPTIGDVVMFMAPIWVAVAVGVLVGWAWKPKWATLAAASDVLDCIPTKYSSESSKGIVFQHFSCLNSLLTQLPIRIPWISDHGFDHGSSTLSSLSSSSDTKMRSSELETEKSGLVTENDLNHLCRLVEDNDGGPAWIQMMDRSTSNMSYQAWRRDPETGPPQYRSRTVFEDATPEMVRDFFWDDEFRLTWDDMLIHSETLEESPTTGTMVVQWVRKFPFFCSDREYIIGRRIWEAGRSYYCVTKSVPCFSVPRRNKPRRVDLYYSSWCIRAVESKRDGQLTACEVLLFHHEDMGIPWEIAKLGVRQGMSGAVRKIEPGLRAYQKQRASGSPLSRRASMAQINTKVSLDKLKSRESPSSSGEEMERSIESSLGKPPQGRNIPKFLVVGGAVVLACSLDRGLLAKAVIFGVARRFANIGRRL